MKYCYVRSTDYLAQIHALYKASARIEYVCIIIIWGKVATRGNFTNRRVQEVYGTVSLGDEAGGCILMPL